MASRTRRFDVEIGSEAKGSGFKDAGRDADKLAADLKSAGQKAKGAFSGVDAGASGLGSKLKGARRDAARAFDGIEADAKGLGSKLDAQGRIAGTKLGDSISEGAEGALDDFGSDVKETLGTLSGVGAGVGFAAAFTEGLDRGASADVMAASLGLSEEQAQIAGDVSGRLYAGAWGDSMGDVHTAVEAVGSTLTSVTAGSEADLERLSIKAMDVANVFGSDVTEMVGLAGFAVEHGLARNADHAFDLITVAMQRMPRGMREELFPAIEEYGDELANMGFTGEEAFGLLAAASRQGQFGIDKTGDSIKEFAIRATDMSATSVAAFDAIGLDARDMANQILAGGDTARGAFERIVTGLLSIDDPAVQAQHAIALFGTPLEDMSVQEIPQFLQSLVDVDSGLGDVSGAAEKAGAIVNDNLKTKLTGVQRAAFAPLIAITDRLASAFLALPGPLQAVVGGLGGVAAVSVPAIWAGKQVASAWRSTMDAISNIGGRMAVPAGAVSGAFDAASESGGRLTTRLGGLRAAASLAAGAAGVAGLVVSLKAMSDAQNEAEAADLAQYFSGVSDMADETAIAQMRLTAEFGNNEAGTRRLNQAFQESLNLGAAQAERFIGIAENANVASGTIDQWRGQLERKRQTDAQAAVDANTNAAAQSNLTGEMEGQAAATGDAVTQMREYADTLRAQFDPMFGMMDALRNNQQATVAVLDAQAAYNDAVAAHGPRSNEARVAQIALTEAEQAGASSALDVTGATAQLNAAIAENPALLDQSKQQLLIWASQGLITEATAADMGRQFDLTAGQARNLGRTDPNVRVSTSGVGSTISNLDMVTGRVNDVPKDVTIRIGFEVYGQAEANRFAALAGREHGGPVDSGRLYEVAEHGKAELLEMAGRTYLIPGSSGSVVPADDMGGGDVGLAGGGGDTYVLIDARGAVGLDESKLEEVVNRSFNRGVQNGRPFRRPPGWR